MGYLTDVRSLLPEEEESFPKWFFDVLTFAKEMDDAVEGYTATEEASKEKIAELEAEVGRLKEENMKLLMSGASTEESAEEEEAEEDAVEAIMEIQDILDRGIEGVTV